MCCVSKPSTVKAPERFNDHDLDSADDHEDTQENGEWNPSSQYSQYDHEANSQVNDRDHQDDEVDTPPEPPQVMNKNKGSRLDHFYWLDHWRIIGGSLNGYIFCYIISLR